MRLSYFNILLNTQLSFVTKRVRLPWVAVGISLIGLTGDLIASAVKRSAGIKDFGRVLGITGGILDKFDGLLFVTPIFCTVAGWIGQ